MIQNDIFMIYMFLYDLYIVLQSKELTYIYI